MFNCLKIKFINLIVNFLYNSRNFNLKLIYKIKSSYTCVTPKELIPDKSYNIENHRFNKSPLSSDVSLKWGQIRPDDSYLLWSESLSYLGWADLGAVCFCTSKKCLDGPSLITQITLGDWIWECELLNLGR